MTEPMITCPNCKTEIKLTESLASPLIESIRKEYERKIQQSQLNISQRETELNSRQEALAKEKDSIEEQVRLKVHAERERISAEENRKARLLVSADLEQKDKEVAELQEVLKERDSKLAAAQQAQADLIRKKRELDDAKREMELTIEKRVQGSVANIRDQARKEAEDQLKLKVLEKEETISSMQRQIEELKRKAEQGSEQLQGEVQELDLESTLRTSFARDTIEPVPKGEHGGDVLHRVFGPMEQACGTILWESKRTKNWSDGWLSKVRDDQRSAKAEIAVMISKTLPRDIQTFDLRDGVWVAEPRYAVPIAMVLRQLLIELAAARQAKEGQQTKMEMLYNYLTGPRFRQRVQAIVEKFSDMQEDLDKERKAMTRLWAKREEQIRGVIEATAGMYGDLQGIAGKTLREVEGLDFKALGPGKDHPLPEESR
jgi:hypothetical protein